MMREVLEELFLGKPLSIETSKAVLAHIAAGKANTSELAAFLACYRMRAPSPIEMRGFRAAMLEICVPVDLKSHDPMDVCGTGGDGKNTFNISTLAAFVVAGAGVKVAKHGNYSASSLCGSSNLLENLGVKFSTDRDVLSRALDRAGICFLHAPLFHPAMKNVGPVRRELGFRTFFNMLGPLLNPCRPQRQLTGAHSLPAARLLSAVLQQESASYVVVHAHDGYDEVSLTGPFSVMRGGSEQTHEPRNLGFERVAAKDLAAGTTLEEAVNVFISILEGKGTPAQEAVVVANAGLALSAVLARLPIQECFARARESLVSKRALEALKRSVE